jgi:hypothetical protein
MHAWVTYELVQALHIYGLTPSVRNNLKDVSLDLFKIEIFLRDRTNQDANDSKHAEAMIKRLLAHTEHSTIFKKMIMGNICHTLSNLQPMLYHFSSSHGCNNSKNTFFENMMMTSL